MIHFALYAQHIPKAWFWFMFEGCFHVARHQWICPLKR